MINSEKVNDKTDVPPPDWEALIDQVADDIIKEHTPERILEARSKLYDLLSHCIPPTTILKVILPYNYPLLTELKADLYSDPDIQTYTKDR